MNAETVWKTARGELEMMISPLLYKAWLKDSYAEFPDDNSVDIFIKNSFGINQINKLTPIIEQSVTKAAKKPLKINFKVGEKQHKTPKNTDMGPLFTNTPTQNSNIISDRSQKAGLSPTMTFDNFVIGPNNQLAFAVAQAVVDNPGIRYNPFFLYSGVGLGKTHLIQAIGNEIIKKHPDLKVIYTPGETFMNELIAAIRGGQGRQYNPAKFRKKYREVDVFLIDDIQFIAGKDSTQEEFFHTFNHLHMAQKQIVITSDRHPKNFNNLEDRITSRFSSGMIADMSPPNVDIRIAILQELRERRGEVNKVPDEVISFIAEKIYTNIRELEGAYNQVITKGMATNGGEVTLEVAAEALNLVIEKKENKNINLNQILKEVAKYYSVTITEIKGKRRKKEIVIPRQMAMYLMYEMTQTPYESIGELLGGRDHTTVLHGVRKVEDGMGNPQKVKQDLVNIKNALYE